MINITSNNFRFQVCGDVTIKIYNKRRLQSGKSLCRVSFNTAFIDAEEEVISFKLKDIDPDNLINNPKIPRNFEVLIQYNIMNISMFFQLNIFIEIFTMLDPSLN